MLFFVIVSFSNSFFITITLLQYYYIIKWRITNWFVWLFRAKTSHVFLTRILNKLFSLHIMLLVSINFYNNWSIFSFLLNLHIHPFSQLLPINPFITYVYLFMNNFFDNLFFYLLSFIFFVNADIVTHIRKGGGVFCTPNHHHWCTDNE